MILIWSWSSTSNFISLFCCIFSISSRIIWRISDIILVTVFVSERRIDRHHMDCADYDLAKCPGLLRAIEAKTFQQHYQKCASIWQSVHLLGAVWGWFMYAIVKVLCVAVGKRLLNQIVVDFDDDVISLVVSEDHRPGKWQGGYKVHSVRRKEPVCMMYNRFVGTHRGATWCES